MLRLRQLAEGASPGFVWEEGGRIVGNASLLPTPLKGRYLVANVAVDRSYRRQGIARSLMEAVIAQVESRGGLEIMLQVKHDNAGAIKLYEGLGFESLGAMTSWQTSHSSLRPLVTASSREGLEGEADEFALRPLRRDEWHAAWWLDRTSVEPDLNWPAPLQRDAYKVGLWRWLQDLLNGRRRETWVAVSSRLQLVGLASFLGEWGRAYTLTLRVHPAWRGQVERVLLAKLLRRVKQLPRRTVLVDHPADDELTNTLLSEANFSVRRTLSVMKLTL